MDDWEARLAALDGRLRDWNRRFEVELERVCRERKLRGWFRKPRPEELQSAAEEARRRAGTEILVELATFLDGLCDLYPKSSPQDRAKIRARVGAAEGVFDLFWGYVEQGPERIRGPQDGPQLARGLVAVVIDDMRAELGLVNGVIGRLLVAAAAAGIDWKPNLAEAAKVANPGAGGGGTCMREHLEGFERSDYFRREVDAKLREAARKSVVNSAGG
jgi:hypothetical protein